MADATLLSWINAEVERALLLVRDCIARFTAAPDDADALRPCPEHLHQEQRPFDFGVDPGKEGRVSHSD